MSLKQEVLEHLRELCIEDPECCAEGADDIADMFSIGRDEPVAELDVLAVLKELEVDRKVFKATTGWQADGGRIVFED